MYLNYLAKLQATRSRIEKMGILKEATKDYTFRHILLYAYHPLWHYHITTVQAKGRGIGTLKREPWTSLLDQLKECSLSGHKAKRTVEKFVRNLTRVDGEVFKNILKKNLRAGISATTINASNISVQIPVFGAMLAKAYSGELKQTMYMSIKYDGVRAIFKHGNLYTRNGHEIVGCSHIIRQAEVLGHSMLDGELMIPGIPFQKSSGMIRSFKDTPKARYKVFDIPEAGTPFMERYTEMQETFKYSDTPSIALVKHVFVSQEEEIQQAYDRVLNAGYEGLMLKDPIHAYVPKRSSSWLKLKATNSVDVPVIGVFEGKNRLEGNLGGFKVCMPDGVVVKVGGGFSDAMRAQIWSNPSEYIGATVEVQYHEMTPDGSLRHPRLAGFRTDK